MVMLSASYVRIIIELFRYNIGDFSKLHKPTSLTGWNRPYLKLQLRKRAIDGVDLVVWCSTFMTCGLLVSTFFIPVNK